MAEKKAYTIHIEETRHFKFEVWAETNEAALIQGQKIWREAPTTGQWELPGLDTGYHAVPVPNGQSNTAAERK